jgi:sugar-specific transcriptional regulator TrmB
MNKKESLKSLGLTEKETTIYLYLLEQGTTPPQTISKETGILRQTIYDIINKMKNDGLITEIKQNKKTAYSATDPKNFLSKIKEKESIAKSILPELNQIMKSAKSNSSAQLYQGIKGIKSINEKVLESKNISTILPQIGEESLQDYYIGNFSKKRTTKKIPIKILRNKIKSEIQKQIKTDKKELREVKILEELTGFTSQIILLENSIAIISFHEKPFGVIIEDTLITNSLKIIFNILWTLGEKF